MLDVSFISLRKVLPAVLACAAERFDALAMVKPQFEVGPRARRAAAAWCATRRRGGARWARWPSCASALGAAVLGFAPSGLPGPGGQPRDVRVAGRGRARRRAADVGGAARGGRRVRVGRASPTAALDGSADGAARADRAPRAAPAPRSSSTPRRRASTSSSRGRGSSSSSEHRSDADLCIVLGGDGTILTALREFAGTGRAGVRDQLRRGRLPRHARPRRAAAATSTARSPATSRRLQLPTIDVGRPEGVWTAINDISVHRKPGMRVADLAYGLAGEEIGRVRCDGLVVATPQGSTGYNLANGGPVLAWGVRGFVVSFIAPHSLTARALVVAPGRPARRSTTRAARSPSRSTSTAARPASCRRGRTSTSSSAARTRRSPSSRARASTTACASASGGWRSRRRRGTAWRTSTAALRGWVRGVWWVHGNSSHEVTTPGRESAGCAVFVATIPTNTAHPRHDRRTFLGLDPAGVVS